MAYTKQTGVPCATGETVVLLDSGQYVAVQCTASRNADSNLMEFVPAARWIESDGTIKTDPSGRGVATIKTLTMSPDAVAAMTPDAVVKECLLLVLGETLTTDPNTPSVTLIQWSPDIVSQCSIRNAIAAASVTAPAASDVL